MSPVQREERTTTPPAVADMDAAEPPKGSRSETSLFEDARSDSIPLVQPAAEDSFLVGLDSILNDTPLSAVSGATNLSTISASELESSRRIRKKYGLDEPAPSVRSSASSLRRGRDYEREVQLLFETTQLLVRRFLDDMVSGGTVENEHPLLQPLLAVIELVLYHGWRGDGALFAPMTLWDLLGRAQKWSKTAESRMVVENVRQFGIRGSARIRAWIRLALMNRSLVPDLTLLLSNESSLIAECYEDFACAKSDLFQPLLALLSTLDPIDFNLFVKESDIPRGDFGGSWAKIFANDRINFDRLHPPIHISLDLLRYGPHAADDLIFARLGSSRQPSLESLSLRDSPDRYAQLVEENARLRKSLVTQINQRAYFQDEYTKSQRRCAQLLAEQHTLREEHTALQARAKVLLDLVDTHEQTNEALQRQLAEAFTDEPVEQCRRLREAINKLSADLEAERAESKAARQEIRAVEEQLKVKEQQIQNLQAQLHDTNESWADRLNVLSEQLKLASSLKDEYKRRLHKPS